MENFIKENKNYFEIIWHKNIGPYRKLLPLLKEKINEDCLIITIDDDTEYDFNLIKNMVADYDKFKCSVAYRGFTMKVKTDLNQLNYEERLPLIKNNLYNFHVGKGGVLYHPFFFDKTKNIIFDETKYVECCKTGDDIWFNFMRIANNINCYIDNKPYMNKDNTIRENGLYYNFNIINKLNTINIRKTVNELLKLKFIKNNNIIKL